MKKERVRQGLSFGIGMTLFYIVQNLWYSNTYTPHVILKAIVTALITGAISGLVFGWLIGTAFFIKLTGQNKSKQG